MKHNSSHYQIPGTENLRCVTGFNQAQIYRRGDISKISMNSILPPPPLQIWIPLGHPPAKIFWIGHA